MVKARILAVVIIGVMLLGGLMPGIASAAPPDKPAYLSLSPANGTENISLKHTFRAGYTGDHDQYAAWWQVATENQTTADGSFSDSVLVFNSGVDTANLGTLSMPRGYLSGNTTYYWHVKQQDIYGNWSPWSDVCQFKTVVTFAPDQPENVAPANGANEIGPSHMFIGSAYYDPDGDTFYARQAQIRRSSGEGSTYDLPLWDSGVVVGGGASWQLPSGMMEYSHTYYWRVRYQDNTGLWSAWSDETSFTTIANSPPSQPQNLVPSDNATGVSLVPTLTASGFRDPNASETVLGRVDTHAASRWQVTAVSENYTSPIWDSGTVTAGLTSIVIPAGKLNGSTKYYWRAAYQDSYGNWSDWSTETSFTTKALSSPTAAFSLDQTQVTPQNKVVTFTDESVAGAEISTWSWNFGDGTTENWTISTRPSDGKATHTYADGGTYTVTLTVTNGTGTDVESKTLTIITPYRPSNVSPGNGATYISPTVTLIGSTFSDPEGDMQAASQWQVTATSGNYSSPLWDSGRTTTGLTSMAVPAGKLAASTTYYWRVRYQDSYGAWSDWSTETSFTTRSFSSPVAGFTYELSKVVVNGSENVMFTDTSSVLAEISTWSWNFGDGTTVNWTASTRPSDGKVTHTYADGGTYMVTLTVTNGTETDSATKTVVLITPHQPVNVSPFNGATEISPSQKLAASAFEDSEGDTHFASHWQVTAVSGNYSCPVFNSGIDVTNRTQITLPVGYLAYGQTYYWHVRYQDSSGAWSAWSDETSFTVVTNSPPAKPTNMLPANGATGVTWPVLFVGSPFDDADGDGLYAYQYQVRRASGYGSTFFDPLYDSGPVAAGETAEITSLSAGETYYWRFRYMDTAGLWSLWSDETSFTMTNAVPNLPPSRPTNLSPMDSCTEVSPDPAFVTSQFDDPDGDSFYKQQMQIIRQATQPVEVDWATPLWDSGLLNAGSAWAYPVGLFDYRTKDDTMWYWWRVRYQDNKGSWSEWSYPTKFQVMENLPPNKPENVGPANGAIGVSLTPALRASDFSDPNSSAYVSLADTHARSEWQLSTKSGADFLANVKWSENVTTSLTVTNIPVELLAGKTYYWRVRYQDNHGNWSAWSTETSFTTKALSVPEAGFSVKTTGGTAGEEAIIFTDNSTPANEIEYWYWDFGDGTTENWTTRNRPPDGQIRHVYTDGGTYTVSLTVVNTAGSDPEVKTDYVVIQSKPKAVIREAAIGASNTAGAGDQMTFTDSSTGDITRWVWDFGDGSSLEEWTADTRPADGKIQHVFSKGGSHVVTLEVSGPAGASIKNWKVEVAGDEGFRFSLWMIGAVVAAVVVVAGVIYLIQSRKATK